jgi:hypothetical protein
MVEALQQSADHRLGQPASRVDTWQAGRPLGQVATHPAIAVYERQLASTAPTAAVRTTVIRCRTPRRARGSGTPANASGSPATRSGGQAPTGATDNDEISDDGNAGMAHFGEINKRREPR